MISKEKMSGRIFVTGDKHGTFTPFFGLADKNQISHEDIIIIAGDAGYVWDDSYCRNVETLQQLFPGIIAFVDGNHENHALLNAFNVKRWNGGLVHVIGERFFHLMRGEMYSIYENNIFVFGGARSVDKDRRTEDVSWWKEEEPSLEEIEYGEKKLEANIQTIDYIITHETPLVARKYIKRGKAIDEDYNLPSVFDRWYNTAKEGERFKKWYFGHMHVSQEIEEKLRALNNEVISLDDNSELKWM